MKKFLTVLFALVLCVPIAFFAAACGGGETATLTDIIVDSTNAKTIFGIGETYSSEGLVVSAKYDNGTQKALPSTDYTINSSVFNNKQRGTYTISISYQEKTSNYDVRVEVDDVIKQLAQSYSENWQEDTSWIKNVAMSAAYFKDNAKIGEEQGFVSDNLCYGSFVDLTTDKSLSNNLSKAEEERWIMPDFAGYIYNATTHTKKQYSSMDEALQGMQFEGVDSFKAMVSSFNGYLKDLLNCYLEVQFPGEFTSDLGSIDPTQLEDSIYYISNNNNEVKFVFKMVGDREETYIFDKTSFALKAWGTKGLAMPSEQDFYEEIETTYTFNATPTSRMKTLPTGVDWTVLN